VLRPDRLVRTGAKASSSKNKLLCCPQTKEPFSEVEIRLALARVRSVPGCCVVGQLSNLKLVVYSRCGDSSLHSRE